MGKQQNDVTSKQVIIAIFSLVIGAGILTVSREVVDTVQTPDAWISILLSGILAVISGVMAVILCGRYPGRTIYQFSTEVVTCYRKGIEYSGIIIFYNDCRF